MRTSVYYLREAVYIGKAAADHVALGWEQVARPSQSDASHSPQALCSDRSLSSSQHWAVRNSERGRDHTHMYELLISSDFYLDSRNAVQGFDEPHREVSFAVLCSLPSSLFCLHSKWLKIQTLKRQWSNVHFNVRVRLCISFEFLNWFFLINPVKLITRRSWPMAPRLMAYDLALAGSLLRVTRWLSLCHHVLFTSIREK